MKTIKFLAVFALLWFSAVAFAQVTPTEIAAEVGVGELIQDASKVAAAVALGWLAALAAVVNLLTNLLRWRPIHNLMVDRQLLWIKPIISVAFGVVLSMVTTLQTGQGIVAALGAGVAAGVLATGGHELLNKRRSEKRQK